MRLCLVTWLQAAAPSGSCSGMPVPVAAAHGDRRRRSITRVVCLLAFLFWGNAGFVLVKKVPGTLHFTARADGHSFEHDW